MLTFGTRQRFIDTKISMFQSVMLKRFGAEIKKHSSFVGFFYRK
jgi:hypothetical protein